MNKEFKDENVELRMEGAFCYARYLVPVVGIEAAKSAMKGKFAMIEDGESILNIIDSSNVKTMTREARKYLSQPDAYIGVKATAILARSPIGAVLGNFYLRLGNFPIPTRMFRNEEDAKEWLLGLNL